MERNMANYLRKILQSLAVLLLLNAPIFAASQLISLKNHYPQKYVVQQGDTLYEIAGKYLNKPWQWKLIWHDNPGIHNPKRLYPGAVLTLRYFDGKPYLKVIRRGTYKLSPQARARPAQVAIPPIYLSDIRPFLNGSRVFDRDELASSGYVVAYNGEHMIGGQNDQIYVQNLMHHKDSLSYALYRPGGKYTDPDDPNHTLGYIAIFLGDAQLIKYGQPSTLELTVITKGIHIKDRVIPNNKAEFDLFFEPQAPNFILHAEVIDLFNDETQVATNQVIVIDKGKNQRLEPGDVVAIWQKPREIQDPMDKDSIIELPEERIAEAMIFRTFTNVSYALIVKSTRAINKGDLITSP